MLTRNWETFNLKFNKKNFPLVLYSRRHKVVFVHEKAFKYKSKILFQPKKNMIALDLIHFFSAYVRSEYIMYVLRMYC